MSAVNGGIDGHHLIRGLQVDGTDVKGMDAHDVADLIRYAARAPKVARSGRHLWSHRDIGEALLAGWRL